MKWWIVSDLMVLFAGTVVMGCDAGIVELTVVDLVKQRHGGWVVVIERGRGLWNCELLHGFVVK